MPEIGTLDHPSELHQATLLIVDDVPENLVVLGEVLRQGGYRVRAANLGQVALRYAIQEPLPDLIILDVMMPDMDGYEVLNHLKEDPRTADIPVIFLTALTGSQDEERGLLSGAADYISKPIVPAVVLARVKTQLLAKQGRDLLLNHKQRLEAEVERRMAENDLIQSASIRALAHLAETRDPETGNHILRTQSFVRVLAENLRHNPKHADQLNDEYISLLTRSAPLHDIGKVGIPDRILLKPGKLTPEEFEIMKTHAALGAVAIEQAELDIRQSLAFLSIAKEIARHHHERWDGTGYPDRLKGDAIPLSARIMTIADVFDALTTVRVYKPAMSCDEAFAIIVAGDGTQFDPDVVAAFRDCFEEFTRIAIVLQDTPNAPC